MVKISFCQITALKIIFKRNISSLIESNSRGMQPICKDRFISNATKGIIGLNALNNKNLLIKFKVPETLNVGKSSKLMFEQNKISRNLNSENQVKFYSNAKENNLLLKEIQPGKDDWGSPEGNKLILHIEGNFQESIQSHDSLLIYFYTVWCKHCKKLKSVYGAAAVKMKEENIPGRLGAIDVTNRMDIADTFNIVSVPALKYFKKGQFIKVYDGKRTTESIVSFMKNPSVEPVLLSKIDI